MNVKIKCQDYVVILNDDKKCSHTFLLNVSYEQLSQIIDSLNDLKMMVHFSDSKWKKKCLDINAKSEKGTF